MIPLRVPASLWIVGAFHVFYFALAVALGNIHLVDSYGYLQQSLNLATHHSWYAEQWGPPFLPDYFSFRPPLYALVILACKAIWASDLSVLVLQNVISICVFAWLRKRLIVAGYSERMISLFLGAALLLFPSHLIHCNLIMSEILLQGCVLICFACTLAYLEKPRLKQVSGAAIAASVALFIKPVVVLLGAGVFALMLLHALKQRSKKTILLPFLLLPLAFHFISLQNQSATGYYHFSSARILYDLRVNARFLIMNQYGEDSSHAYVTHVFNEADRAGSYEDRYKTISDACSRVILDHKAAFAVMYARGILTFFADPGRFDVYTFFGITGHEPGLLQDINTKGLAGLGSYITNAPIGALLLLMLAFVWNIVVLVCLLRMLFDASINRFVRLAFFLFIFYFAFISGISGIARYRVPVYPVMLLGASLTLLPWIAKRFTHATTRV
jgi:hypothetical protein